MSPCPSHRSHQSRGVLQGTSPQSLLQSRLERAGTAGMRPAVGAVCSLCAGPWDRQSLAVEELSASGLVPGFLGVRSRESKRHFESWTRLLPRRLSVSASVCWGEPEHQVHWGCEASRGRAGGGEGGPKDGSLWQSSEGQGQVQSLGPPLLQCPAAPSTGKGAGCGQTAQGL